MKTLNILMILVLMTGSLSAADVKDKPTTTVTKSARTIAPRAWTFLDKRTMEYSFGHAIARSTLGIQVTLENSDQVNDLIVHAIKVRIGDNNEYSVSSLDKQILGGIAERGQDVDPRNVWLRAFRAAGIIAVSVGTFSPVGPAFLPAVAAFNGPFIAGYSEMFPDYTVNQIVRLQALAFDSDKVITKSSSTVVVVFVPIKMVFGEKDRKLYKHKPHDLLERIASTMSIKIYGNRVAEVPE